MSTCNFYNSKNGIFVLPGSTEFNGMDDSELAIMDFMEDVEDDLEKIDWSMTELDNDQKCTIYDNQGRIAGELEVVYGYYSGIQIVYRTGHDLYAECNSQEYGVLKNEYNFHYKYVLKVMQKNTDYIKCVGVFSNGEAVYEKSY